MSLSKSITLHGRDTSWASEVDSPFPFVALGGTSQCNLFNWVSVACFDGASKPSSIVDFVDSVARSGRVIFEFEQLTYPS